MSDRRAFLKFLATSPLYAAVPSIAEAFQQGNIQQAADALDVFDFQAAAEKIVPPAHWGYLATGTDDDGTIRANREGFTRWDLRPRRLIDVSKIDMSVQIHARAGTRRSSSTLWGANARSIRRVSSRWLGRRRRKEICRCYRRWPRPQWKT